MLPTLIAVTSMLSVAIHLDLTLARVKLDIREMETVVLVSYFCLTDTKNNSREIVALIFFTHFRGSSAVLMSDAHTVGVVEEHFNIPYNFALDIDECSSNSNSCDVNAVCNNILGSYTCTCKAGYSGDGQSCTGELFLFKVHISNVLKKISESLRL